jgi:hypothetical protein
MTVPEALEMVKRVGAVEVNGEKLRVRFPEAKPAAIEPALYTLRMCKAEALSHLAALPETGPAIDLATVSAIMNRTGCRLMELDGRVTIGIWADLDGPEIRAAIRAFGNPPVKYLDSAGIPQRYKVRDIPGKPLPAEVLRAMLQNPIDPWRTRDDTLATMNWRPAGIPWAEAQAARLNLLFRELGNSGQPGFVRIKQS